MKTLRCTADALVIRDLPGGADTGRRIVHGQTVTAYGESYDGGWAYVAAPAGTGWSSLSYLESADGVAELSSWPAVPHGLAGIRALYGEPASPICTAGVVRLPAALPLAWDLSQSVTSFRCHQLVEAPFTSTFGEIHRRGLWGLLEDFGGCFNDRTARGLQKKSTHAWAIAVDVNVRSNPLGRAPKLDLRIVAVFEEHGFLWGGRWSRPDGMHFQRATGY